ncbi:DUF6531 domain-containing protein [Sulfurimicrobium lacus]|uniref:DUF6531 domain-containing protein n=1 Tax=Sulfurimicrobium lacus TaxID=2715678 RepID=UPI001564602C|nr:DUF6531 domain-containing protein [Sulfurimicrobium lacus]
MQKSNEMVMSVDSFIMRVSSLAITAIHNGIKRFRCCKPGTSDPCWKRRLILMMLFSCLLPSTFQAHADGNAPLSVSVEFYSVLYCENDSCCPVLEPGGVWGSVRSGVKTDPAEACLALLKASNDVQACRHSPLFAGSVLGLGDYPWCEMVSAEGARGTTLSAYTTTCPPNSTSSNGVCACNAGFYASNSSCLPISPKNFGACTESSPQTPNPISIGSGNKYLSETDYVGGGPFPLKITRVYNGRADFFSRIGYNWRTGIQSAVTHIVYYETQVNGIDNRALKYTLNNNQWVADGDVPEKLTRLADASGTTVGWTLRKADDTLETYDANGRLLSIADRQQRTQTLTYSDGTAGPNGGYVLDAAGNATTMILPLGRVIRLTDSNGRFLRFDYDISLQIVMITDPAGGKYRYAYDANRNLKSVTYPDNKVRTYHYNEAANTGGANLPHALTGITDENGVRYATYSYDSSGRAIGEAHAGNVDTYGLNFGTNSTAVTDPLGTVRTYNFQTILGVAKSTGTNQPGGSGCGAASSAQTYDGDGNLSSRTDFNGTRTTYSYDLTRNLETSRIEAVGTPQARTISTSWHPSYRLPLKIAEPQRLTSYTYDAQGNPLTKTLQSTLDATGAQGLSATPVGTPRTWTYTYNPYGQILTLDGPRTDVADLTTYTYYGPTDPDLGKRGNLASLTNALGYTTQISAYDLNGNPLTLIDPNGLATQLGYDLRQRLTSRSVGGETTRYQYDNVGQLTQIVQPDGSSLNYTYDDAHRLTRISDSLGNRIDYTLDAIGNRTREEIHDPSGTLTQLRQRVFDALNRLAQDIGAQNQSTAYRYDANGNLTGITDPLNRNTANAYDGSETRYTWDLGQNGLGRLGKIEDYTGGVLTSANQYSYDPQGRVNTETRILNGISYTTAYSYSGGRLAGLTYPSGRQLAYTRDSSGHISEVRLTDNGQSKVLAGNIQYQPFGGIKSYTDGSGQTHTRSYDQDGRIAAYSLAGQTWLLGYDLANRITAQIDGGDAAHSAVYGYDNLDRLTGAVLPTTNYGYAYDPNGNRVSQTTGAATRSYTTDPASNRLLAIDSPAKNYAYDANGSTTNDGTNQLAYDAKGRLAQAVTAAGTTHYQLNALGQRIRKSGSADTVYLYDTAGHLIAETTPAGQTLREYVYLNDIPLVVLQ